MGESNVSRGRQNLLTETLENIRYDGQSPEAVAWVGNGKVAGTWDAFAALADFDYDAGFGGQNIHASLRVVFNDGSWLERHEYDGSEWWEYKKTPLLAQYDNFDTLTHRGLLNNHDGWDD